MLCLWMQCSNVNMEFKLQPTHAMVLKSEKIAYARNVRPVEEPSYRQTEKRKVNMFIATVRPLGSCCCFVVVW